MIEGDYTITQGGVFVFTGTLADGQILVNAGEDDKVQIVLNGASVSNSDGPAIYAVEADKVFVTAADGTQNRWPTEAAMRTMRMATRRTAASSVNAI